MYQHYLDILENVDRPPVWFDEHAVPRYCAFEPSRVASIHAPEAALVEIRCQGCEHPFRVAFSHVNWADTSIREAIRAGLLHFGDPPNIRCCASNSSNSIPLRVIEYWRRMDEIYTVPFGRLRRVVDPRFFEWTRDGSLEVTLAPPWEK